MLRNTNRLRAACDGRRHGNGMVAHPMQDQGIKQCSRCGDSKPLDAFNVARTNRDGRSSWCRSCFRSYNAAKQAVKRAAQIAVNELAQRTCKHCGEPLDPALRTDARYCSRVCTHRAIGLRWYYVHKDRIRERDEGTLFQDAQRMSSRKRHRANPELARRASRKRKALRKTLYVEDVETLVLLEMDDGVCGICGDDVDPFDFHVDHVIPMSRGGEHSYANTQVAHPLCNKRKHATLPWETP